MKTSIRVGMVVLAMAMVVPAVHALVPSKTYGVKATLTGRAEDDSKGKTVLISQSITGNMLVNLAMGRAPTAPVPANQVLAARILCGAGISALVVFDTTGSSNLVTIASTGSPPSAIAAGTKAEFVGLLNFQPTGNSSNAVSGGYLVISGKATVDTNGCPTKITATVTGVLDGVFTDDVGTKEFEALIPKGSVSTTILLVP